MKKVVKSAISAVILLTTFAYLSPAYAISNKETIYSKLDSNGDRYKTIVTTKENDAINQEDSEKDLPIEAKITYELDGIEIEPQDLAGKSGKVKIKIEYENKSAKKVTLNGKEQTMYTPFVVALGTIIDNKNNKNIEVSKAGRIIENGEKTIVVGVVFPGLNESLNLSEKLSDIKIPNSIEITMDAEKFEMTNIITYATPKVLTENIDWSDFDDLFNSVNELKDGIDKIEDGAKKIEEGTKKLDDGAKELSDGISTAYDGSKEIKSQVSKSIKTIEKDKSKALDKDTLNKIAEQASATAGANIKKQLETIGNSAKTTATKTIGDQTEAIGKQASNDATEQLKKQIETIKSAAKTGAVSQIKVQEDTIISGVASLITASINNNLNALVTGIATGVTSAMNTQLSAMEEQAVKAGISTIDLSKLSKSTTVENVTVSVGNDYKNSEDYKNLDIETQELVDGIIEKVEKQAGNKATTAAQNAVDNFVLSEKEEIESIAEKASVTAATVTSKGLQQGVIKATAEASVKQTAEQIAKQISSESAKKEIGTQLESLAGQIASGTAESVANQIAASVASQTAQSTAKQVAGEVANTTAQSVAKQVAESVAGQTAKSVADTVADEVKDEAMKKVKEKMETLLNDGMTPLTDGLKKLRDGAKTLKLGTDELNSGSSELTKGIHKFNTEGITKITNFVNVDLKNVVNRGKKLEELANEYNKFKSDIKREDINFISMVDSIKSKNDDKED